VPHALFLGVRLDQRHELVGAAGEAQVAQRLVVHREDRDRRAVLGRHVADRGAVLDRDVGHARSVELDKAAHHPVGAQHVGDGEDQIGGGCALRELPRKPETDDFGDEHRDGLAEKGRLGLDAADTPADHAEAVDHRRVRVGAHQRVGEGVAVASGDDRGEVLEVDLVADPGGGRHDAEAVERLLTPAKELIALEVPLVLELGIAGQCLGAAEDVHLHGVVDHQICGDEGVERLRVAALLAHRVAHGRQIDDGGHPGEVLHQHPGGPERDLPPAVAGTIASARPLRQGGDVVVGDLQPVVVAQQVLEQDLERIGQPADPEVVLERAESLDAVPPTAGFEGGTSVDGGHRGHATARPRRRS
jgi:hypothetical protein